MPKKIVIQPVDCWNRILNRFEYFEGTTITIEHSLISIAKWEAKWHKPFLGKEKKTQEETKDYIKCMTISSNVKDEAYNFLSNKNYEEIQKYIDDPMTATWFGDENKRKPLNSRVLTNELIYYYMISFGIPMECEKWHLNHLITLIRVCNEENKPKKKSKANDLYKKFNRINDMRHSQFGE